MRRRFNRFASRSVAGLLAAHQYLAALPELLIVGYLLIKARRTAELPACRRSERRFR
jgi:hypothetical protein